MTKIFLPVMPISHDPSAWRSLAWITERIDVLREEASRLAIASNPPEGQPFNREVLRERLHEVEAEIDKLLVERISRTT